MLSVWSPWLPFTLLIISRQHVRTHLISTYRQMFVEDQLFPWYLGLGICVGMCSVSQTLGSQQLLIYNLDSPHLLSVSRISWSCFEIFHTLGPNSLLHAAGSKKFLPWDLTMLALIGHLFFSAFSPFGVIFKETLVNTFPHSESMWENFQNWGYFHWRKCRTLSCWKRASLACFSSYCLNCVFNIM